MSAARHIADALRDARNLQNNLGAVLEGLRQIVEQVESLQRQAGIVAYAASRAETLLVHEAPPLVAVPRVLPAAGHLTLESNPDLLTQKPLDSGERVMADLISQALSSRKAIGSDSEGGHAD